jgi:amino acid adenylation domain-containing protein
MFMLLMSAFKILLHRYSGQERIVVGTPVAGRNHLELEPLIGCFVNILAVKTDLGGEPSVREAIRREREAALGAYAHQDVPFEKIVEELQQERDLSRHPIFQATFVYERTTEERVATENLKLSEFDLGFNQVQYDLRLAVTESPRGMTTVIKYCKALFNASLALRMLGHLRALLEGVAEGNEQKIREIEILSDWERGQVLYEWNDAQVEYPSEKRIHELFAEQAEQSPERIALICERRQVSYGELNRRANQLGRYLQGLGVGPEVVVGVCLDRSVEMIVAVLGILKAGGAYLPLDFEYPLERLSFMLEDAGVGVVLTQRGMEERLPTFWGQTVLLDEEWDKFSKGSESNPGNWPESEVIPGSLAYVIYTSGSSGAPKGVAVHQQALVARSVALRETYKLTSADRLLQFVSPSFDAFGEEVFTTLSCGASLIIDKQAIYCSAQEYVDMVERLAITTLHSTAASWSQLVDELSLIRRNVSGPLRLYIAGGEAPSAETLKKWTVLAPHKSEFVNAYGPTEATITSAAYRVEVDSNPIHLQTRVPIGHPIANTQIYILDLDQEIAPIGVKGELYIGGAGVARGYLGRPEMSAEKFIPNPFSGEAGARLYRTGDVGRYQKDGKIETLGRIDEQVKIRGYRIEPGEIENVLRAQPGVQQAVVIAREDEPGQKRLIAYVVADSKAGDKKATKPDADNKVVKSVSIELRRAIERHLPSYMAPSAIVLLERLPLTPNGKLDRRALPAPEGGAYAAKEYEAPVGEIEAKLAVVWADLLKLERVGRQDNFFELGGHSLLATRVVSRIHDAFQVEIPLSRFFEAPTIADLALAVVQHLTEQVQSQEVVDLLTKLEKLSDGEARSILAGGPQLDLVRRKDNREDYYRTSSSG